MKKILFYSAALMLSAMSFTACSDSNDDPTPNVFEEKTYTMGNGLTLNVSGAPMYGKSVTVSPAKDMKTAKITMQSEIDFADIPGFPEGLVENTNVQCPGVIPGTPVETLTVNLVPDGENYTFSGDSETTYCTYKYSGKLTETSVDVNISDVMLKNQSLANTTWNTGVTNEEGYADGIRLIWEPEDKAEIDLGFQKMSIQTILQVIVAIPMIEIESDEVESDGESKPSEVVSAQDMLNMVLKSITFLPDGNIVAKYMDVAKGGKEYVTSPSNMIQYVVSAEGKLLIFINPQAVMVANSRAVDLNQMIKNVWNMVTPMLANGVPVDYRIEGDNMQIFIGNDVMMPILKNVLLPIVSDDAMRAMLIQMIASSEDMADMKEILEAAINSLPAAIEATTNIEIGLNLKK